MFYLTERTKKMPTELKCNDLITGVLPSDTVIGTDKLTIKAEPMTVSFNTKFNAKSFMAACGFDVIVYP